MKPLGWVSWRSAAAFALQLLPWPGSGTVLHPVGVGRREAGGAREGLAIDKLYEVLVARRYLTHGMLQLAVGTWFPREQQQPTLRVSDCPLSAAFCADMSSSSLLG